MSNPRPFVVGDRVRVAQDVITGTVAEINPRSVIIRDDAPEYPAHDRLEFSREELTHV